MTWISYPIVSKEDTGSSIDQMIGKYAKDRNSTETTYLYKVGEIWKSRIAQYFPTRVTRTLILTLDKEQVSVIPCRYNCNKTGIHDQKNGWKHLLKNIQVESICRVIQLYSESAELYEITNGSSSLLIQQNIGRKNRWHRIQEFAKAVWQICKDHKGPLIARMVDDGIHQLDLNIISNLYPVHRSLVFRNNSNIHEWCRNMMLCGLMDQWIYEWQENLIEEAKQCQKWITYDDDFITFMQHDRINSMTLNESNIEIFNNNHECISLLFRNNIKFFRTSRNNAGFIVK